MAKRKKKAAARRANLGGGYADYDHSGFYNDSDDEVVDIVVSDYADATVVLGELSNLPATTGLTIPTQADDLMPLRIRVTAAVGAAIYNDGSVAMNGRFTSSGVLEVKKSAGENFGRIWSTLSKSGVFRDIVRRTPWKAFAAPLPPPFHK